MSLAVRRCGITVARQGVARLHRHLRRAPRSGLFAFELVRDGWPIGWAMVGRPGSRVLDGRGWIEVTRVAVPPVVDGGPLGGCSAMYGAAAREAWRRGAPIITYTRIDESGVSLRGAGWVEVGKTRGGRRDTPSRRRAPLPSDGIVKVRWMPGNLLQRLAVEIARALVVRP